MLPLCSTSWKAEHVIDMEHAKYTSLCLHTTLKKKKDHFQILFELTNADVNILLLQDLAL